MPEDGPNTFRVRPNLFFPLTLDLGTRRSVRQKQRDRLMNSATTVESTERFWSDEPSIRPGRRQLRARIAGLHCSLCTGTIEKVLERQAGVDKVAVSLTHEQALVEYDPSVTGPAELVQALKEIGYTVSDPPKLPPYHEDNR